MLPSEDESQILPNSLPKLRETVSPVRIHNNTNYLNSPTSLQHFYFNLLGNIPVIRIDIPKLLYTLVL